MVKKSIFIAAAYLIFYLLPCCNTTEPPPPPNGTTVFNTINLAVEWTDLHRIKIKWNISAKDTLNSYRYELRRKDESGGEITKNFFISGTDTSYVDGETDSLASGKEFSYKVRAYDSGEKLIDTSKTITAKTLAPTSHNITWTIETLGQAGNFLNDVWGFDENNVYAVGYVDLPEGSSGIIKWDGTKWNPFPASAGVKYGIFGFSESSIFVVGESSNRGFAGIWNGSGWTTFFSDYFYSRGDTVYQLRAVWGSAPDDVWAVGDNGTIIHWDGAGWDKIEIGSYYTQFRLTDIWGFRKDEVYIGGVIYQQRVLILKFNGSQWEAILDASAVWRNITLWGPYENSIYFVDYKAYEIKNGQFIEFILPDHYSALLKIRGSGKNNIFIAGHFGEVFHYNGADWAKMYELYTFPASRLLKGVWTNGEKVFIVGEAINGLVSIRGNINN